MNKRLFSVFLVVLLLALAVTSSVSAQGPVVSRLATVSVGSYDVAVGDTFTVPVTITGVSNLYGADVKLVFDNTVLQAVSPDVAEINFFHYDECENVFWWQTDSEVDIWAFRLEHPAAGWVGERLNAANYPSVHGMTYAIYGPMHADLAGDYWLRVFFDNGTSRMEDMAERVCEWQPKSLQTRLTDVAK